MENISLSNSCINCVNLEENKCSIHHVEVSPANTCDTFTTIWLGTEINSFQVPISKLVNIKILKLSILLRVFLLFILRDFLI